MKRRHWQAIGVRRGARRLIGAPRLAALLRWQQDGLLEAVTFFDTVNDDRELASDATAVDWTHFPTQEALDAVDLSSGSA